MILYLVISDCIRNVRSFKEHVRLFSQVSCSIIRLSTAVIELVIWFFIPTLFYFHSQLFCFKLLHNTFPRGSHIYSWRRPSDEIDTSPLLFPVKVVYYVINLVINYEQTVAPGYPFTMTMPIDKTPFKVMFMQNRPLIPTFLKNARLNLTSRWSGIKLAAGIEDD